MFTHRHTDHRVDEHDLEESHGVDELALHESHGEELAHEEYGGINAGADFFGWLVAVAVFALLTGVVGAVAAAVGQTLDLSLADARDSAETVGIVSAAILVVLAGIGYYAGGYVAGRMSRFDGGRQGFGVWLIGLVAMVIAGGVGAAFGREYDVLDRVDLQQLPIGETEAGLGGLVTGVVLLLVTLLAALAGGRVGRNYHRKVDAAHLR